MIPDAVLKYVNDNYERSIAELTEFLRIPGISSVESHAPDVRQAAEWLLARVKRSGLDVTLYGTPGHPVVFAEYRRYPDIPTVMFYAHYDVAPPGPPEEWKTSPFSPVVKDGRMFARGAVDDKGQLFTILQAIDAIMATEGRLPLNVKLLFEGEEEAGGSGTAAFVRAHKDLLVSDCFIVIDILKYRADLPAIYYGAKGLLSVGIEVTGPAMDVHSGIYGGEIANPAQALARIIDMLKDADGRISIPGFYDRVRDITPAERAEMASLPFDEAAVKARTGVSELVPEKGYTPTECIMARPTLDVNGLWGGALRGEPLMIIPAEAGAQVSMRLVPDQSPDDVYTLFEAYVRSLTPPGVLVRLRRLFGDRPFVTPLDSDAVKICSRAIRYAFGTRPVLIRSGGTSGIVSQIQAATGIRDIVTTGWGDPGDGEHSPDEHISIENYRKGIIATAAIMYELARAKKREPVQITT